MTTFSYGYTVGAVELRQFKSTWPCNGIDDRVNSLHFQWNSSGDLVDLVAQYRNGRRINDAALYDGPAMVALSLDCQAKMHPEHARVRGWQD